MSDSDKGDLDRRLRRERPEPRDEFVSSVAHRLTSAPTPRRAGLRIAFAGGFTALLVCGFAVTGGISYAANAVHGGTTAVTALVTGPSNAGQASDKAQNGNKGNNGNKGDNGTKGDNGNGNKGDNGNTSSDPSTGANVSAQASPQSEGKTTICHVPSGNPDNPQTNGRQQLRGRPSRTTRATPSGRARRTAAPAAISTARRC